MPRLNKIFAGPFTDATPQVQERPAAASILPGIAIVDSGTTFTVAGANSAEKLFVAQDNYLALKGVDDAYATGDTAIGLEMLNEQFFNVRVPTGVSVTRGQTKLTTSAAGKFVIATTGQRVVAVAEETYNNNTGSDQLVRVRRANLPAAA